MTCSDCGQETLGPGVCIDCSRRRFDEHPRLKAIVERLQDYISFECNPAYSWSAKKVYDDLNKIMNPDYKPSKPVGLDQIKSIKNARCPYAYVSCTSTQSTDIRCVLEEGHIGDHMKREIFPPAQPRQQQEGWIKL